MERTLLFIVALLLLVILALWGKVYFLRRSAREITEALGGKITDDTNTLLDISSRDRYMRELAAELNGQLRLLRAERRRYQQGDQELKEAVTDISHDLRTPLTAIRGYLDLLDRRDHSETVQRYLSRIRERTEVMGDLTEELFRYSIVTAPRPLSPERVDLVRALEEDLLSFYAALEARSIRPEIQLPEGPLWRRLDRGALRRILSNIVGNALKYSDGDLAVTMDSQGRVTFSNSAKALDPVAVGRLFDRYYTVESRQNSTGLGLSIARLLTERQGGAISADYADGRLNVTLFFPE